MEAALHAGSLLAAGLLQPLSENSRLDHPLSTVSLYPGIGFVNSNTATGLRVCLYDDRRGSRATGKERDSESGLDYFGARYYGSALGRFTSPDWSTDQEPIPYASLDNPQSLNLYAYVRNNPMNRRDLNGHWCVLGFGTSCDPCKGNVNTCVTVTATVDPIPGENPSFFSMAMAVGHHWFNQRMIKTWDPNSLAARLANKATTGPLANPAANANDALQRANNKEVTKMVLEYLKETGKSVTDLTKEDFKVLAQKIENAEGSIGAFNERMMTTNPGVRTAEQAVQHAAELIGSGLEEVEEVCSSGECAFP